jgi:uncharacterized membrane protein YidH (DUF202 family)
VSEGGSRRSAAERGGAEAGIKPPGLARDRTALAWTRSALNMAGSGLLISRAAFTANLRTLGVASTIVTAIMALLIWRHGQTIYRQRGLAGRFPYHQPAALGLLTVATVLTAVVAILVTVAI